MGEYLTVIAITSIIVVILVIPFAYVERPPLYIKRIGIPIIFLKKKRGIQLVDVKDYDPSISASIAVDELFRFQPTYEKRFIESLERVKEKWIKGNLGREEWVYSFIKHLGYYLLWSKIQTFCIDYFDEIKELKDVKTSRLLFKDYPTELSSNIFIRFFTSSEKKPQEDTSNVVINVGKYGTWMNPDFLYLEVPEGVTFEVGGINGIPFLKFKSKFGELKIEFEVFSLSMLGEKIRFYTTEKLDFEDFPNVASFELVCRVTHSFSRFSTLRVGFENYVEWIDALVNKLDEMDWRLFLQRIPIEKISEIEKRIAYLEKLLKSKEM